MKSDLTPVVGDFGLCYLIDEDQRLTSSGEAVGARHFTAPELEDGRLDRIKPDCDVYSLGKILYWIFARKTFGREQHRDPKWNLTRLKLPALKLTELNFVNELLDNSIVQEPAGRFRNANHFGASVDQAVWRIQRHAHTINLSDEEIQICNYCGIGGYQRIGDSNLGNEIYGYDEAERFGITHRDHAKWLVMWCNHCGHVQHFRTDPLQRHNNPWKDV